MARPAVGGNRARRRAGIGRADTFRPTARRSDLLPRISAAISDFVRGPAGVPRSVSAAFWLYLSAGVVNVLVGLAGLVALGQVDAAVARAKAQPSTAHLSASAVATSTIVTILVIGVIAVAWGIAVVALAVRLRAGRRRPRIWLAILAVLSIVGVVGLGAVTLVLAAAGFVASFLPSSSAYLGGEPVGARGPSGRR